MSNINVIHGIGTPRLLSTKDALYTGATPDSPATAGDTGYIILAADYTSTFNGLFGSGNWSLIGRYIETIDGNGDNIYGKITSVDGSDVKKIYVDAWYGGDEAANVPVNSKTVYIRGFMVDLPYCESLWTYVTKEAVEHKLQGEIKQIFKGYWHRFVLDYTSYMKKNVLESLEFIFNWDEESFFLIPRKDNADLMYEVYIPDGFELAYQQIQQHQGHRGISLEFKSKYRKADIDLTSAPTYKEYGYGDYYGYYI